MADGSHEPIQDIRVGDWVQSRNEQTGEVEAKQVTATTAHLSLQTVTVTLTDPHTHKTQQIVCTPNHPFYVAGQGFTPAGSLGIGTSIVTRAGPSLAVSNVQPQAAAAQGTMVYNLIPCSGGEKGKEFPASGGIGGENSNPLSSQCGEAPTMNEPRRLRVSKKMRTMKQTTTHPLRTEFFRAAGPTLACIGLLIALVIVPPAVNAVSHALARMQAQRRHEPLSILDMTSGEKDAIMTKHHVQLLTYLRSQYLTMSAEKQGAEQAQAQHPSEENAQAIQLRERCLGYIVKNYDTIASQTPPDILDRKQLPRELP